jgi:dihydrofolate synthase/folylpolyglutamate synthase
MVAAASSEAGLKTALFTSPHLHRFSERFNINGSEVSEELLNSHLERVLALTEGKDAVFLTFFEVTTLTAFLLFRDQNVDLAVLEAGLGGRFDATSICNPIVTAITSVGMDHMDILGDTLLKIATEKAMIAQRGVCMVTGPLSPDVIGRVERITDHAAAPLLVMNRDFKAEYKFTLPWPGAHYLQNAHVALKIIEQLNMKLDSRFTFEVFKKAVAEVKIPGRFEIIAEGSDSDSRIWLLDGAHNPEASEALLQAVKKSGIKTEVVIFGALSSKPVDSMLDLMVSTAPLIIMAPPPLPRAFDYKRYSEKYNTLYADTIYEALKMCNFRGNKLYVRHNIKSISKGTAAVLVTGSFFTVAKARTILLKENSDPYIAL